MPKLFFIAGEPGSGKSSRVAKPLRADGLGLILHTDRIAGRAANHYPYGTRFGAQWQAWKQQFDNPRKHNQLLAAFTKSMRERVGPAIHKAENLIVEGVHSGHPVFRDIFAEVLQDECGFFAEESLTIWLCPPWSEVRQNLKSQKRRKERPDESRHTEEWLRDRSKDYRNRLRKQGVYKCAAAEVCLQVARQFLTK